MSNKGFTIIEVGVVLATLAFIAILAFSFFGASLKEASELSKRHVGVAQVDAERYIKPSSSELTSEKSDNDGGMLSSIIVGAIAGVLFNFGWQASKAYRRWLKESDKSGKGRTGHCESPMIVKSWLKEDKDTGKKEVRVSLEELSGIWRDEEAIQAAKTNEKTGPKIALQKRTDVSDLSAASQKIKDDLNAQAAALRESVARPVASQKDQQEIV